MPGSTPFALDPRLASLQRALPDLAESDLNPVPTQADAAQAAVSLVLRAGPDIELLLIRRAEAEGDPWSFPEAEETPWTRACWRPPSGRPWRKPASA